MEIKSEIRWFDVVESTNDEVRKHISELDNLSVIAAEYQTKGRGQGDHKWHSRSGENLTFTVALKFGGDSQLQPLDVKDSLLITEVTTLALRLYLADKGIKARIKWPNDIYVGDKKICGMLIENILDKSQVSASIVGIGLNINQTEFPADLPNPTSVKLLTGRDYSTREELELFCSYLAECALKTNTAEGRRYLDDIFNQYMFRLDAKSE